MRAPLGRRLTGINQRFGEIALIGAHISPLSTASTHVKPEPTRTRKLLLHRKEINMLMGKVERAGYTPSFALSGGGADANVFNARGLQCVNLANGALLIHTPDEHVAVADLEGMVEVTLELIAAARASD